MNRKQKTKLAAVLSLILLVGGAIGLMLFALKQNINLFYTPTQLQSAEVKFNQSIRLGGYVKKGSVNYDVSGKQVTFVVTDRTNELMVHYQGVLPNLFREGQVVVVTGKLAGNKTLSAEQVLAKHDEKYMPRPLAQELAQEKDA